MSKKGRHADPHAEREAQRYDNPIPSREAILALLSDADKPLNSGKIAKRLDLHEDQDLDALRKRLRAMERDGQLMLNRRGDYGLVDKLNLLHCRVQGHRDGYGFAIPLADGEDVYLSARQMQFVFDGDEVLVLITGLDRRGRAEGKVVEVLNRGNRSVVGRYQEEGGIGFVVPDNARIQNHILIPPAQKSSAQSGQIVTAKITDYPTRYHTAKGTIIEVLGEHMDPGMEIDVAIRSHNIPHEWPEEVQREAAALEQEPREEDKLNRVDLRDKPFVTIDGEDARDFDDAVYCEKRLGGWRLWVAIADVSHYVRPGSALDAEAALRGNSVYFPERVIPMLPEALSNGLCSLMPGVDRLAMVCEMELSRSGNLVRYRFFEAIIHSHARLTYNQVAAAIEDGEHEDIAPAIVSDLQRLQKLYTVLRGARDKRGAIDFDTVETRIIFNEQRKIEAIVPVKRNDAHKLIEECMLCANVAAARFFEEQKIPMVFRVHEGPSGEKLENLRGFLGELGLDLRGGDKPSPEDYQTLLSQVAERDDAPVIQTMMLRSLSQARYRPDNEGHFGLNYEAYTHFTSPIRRYADLLVHRGIRHVIRSKIKSKRVQRIRGAEAIPAHSIFPYDEEYMVTQGEHCSMTERRADDATRDVQSWLKCEYLQERVGDEFDGVISAVTSFGLFVELSDLYIEGLVHISALPGDYYQFDASKQRLLGERSGRVFKLGGKVRVQVARVDLDDKKIDLEMLDTGAKSGKKSGGASSKKQRSKASKGKDKQAKAKDNTAKAEQKPAKAKKAKKAKDASGDQDGGQPKPKKASRRQSKTGLRRHH
ncbi:ribonuclease R [Parahaliea sp. F7430]|uniref:Ribonuclease R n=1 Tax=Sediminihaliea albiluteola TaxID=2758564 RepID=A0A7W2YIT4_9GAMM|nr:ribonuclease R [Sediminihaliea albiluteola]MBA6411588.1 ribonuclease R [Sediminihaliea albiluteola]